MNRIIYYYQTFKNMYHIVNSNSTYVTDIILGAIHFGYNSSKPYIHLNDFPPNYYKFNNVWSDLDYLKQEKNVNIHLMVGGAGGAFTELFNNFDIFYNLLKQTILEHDCITGINLDIEEQVDINNVINLIQLLVDDFGENFTISFAPVETALIIDAPGIGGFLYKDLKNSRVGKYIDYYLGQFYGDFNFSSYDTVIKNGWLPDEIVIGMLSQSFNKDTFIKACFEINTIKQKYNDFGGVFTWEYFNAPPNPDNPYEWAKIMKYCIRN